MTLENHFSSLAKVYSRYRPGYPPALFEFLSGLCAEHNLAWDCGTGNGQAALALAEHFDKVIATDASSEQISQAQQHPKITYKVERAEEISIDDGCVDIVTVAIAVHWFDFNRFFREVKRVLKPDGIIAVWTYHLLKISPSIDPFLEKYKDEVLKNYWPERFKYVNSSYISLPFPFEEIPSPSFEMTTEWNLEETAGFLSSWSGAKNYENEKGIHPLNEIWNDLKSAWGDEKKKYKASWPLHVRIGKV